jgi:2-polyprenyl-3-methyl-5-hydroxy-6-metoxy-1,4-benzoquinol methylase
MKANRLTLSFCDGCASNGWKVLFHATDHREGLGGTFALVECTTCGLVRTEPRPGDVSAWYPASYANHAARPSATVRAINAALGYCGRPRRHDWLAAALGQLVPNAVLGPRLDLGTRILDVGAGTGGAVAAIRAQGHDAWGLEPSASAVAVAHAQGRETVRQGTLDDSDLTAQRWDLIRFTHVLEHVPSPVTTLRTARALLNPGGRIVILVPNFGGAGRQMFGRSWDGLEVPRHLHHFTRRSMARVLDAAELTISSMRSTALLGVSPASIDAWTCKGQRQRGWGRLLVVRVAFYPLDLAVAAVGLGDGLLVVATR